MDAPIRNVYELYQMVLDDLDGIWQKAVEDEVTTYDTWELKKNQVLQEVEARIINHTFAHLNTSSQAAKNPAAPEYQAERQDERQAGSQAETQIESQAKPQQELQELQQKPKGLQTEPQHEPHRS